MMDEKFKSEDGNNQSELDMPTVVSEKGVLLRTSARVSKKLRMTPVSTSPGPSSSKLDTNDAPVFKSVKIRRELWSLEETNSFFEGLNEFGKDFESIQWFMVNRIKRKGSCEQAIKSKEQLRHFYYRIWHKICKYIEFPKEIPKVVQELYGLINYGELKRRVGFCNDKNWSKLYEMIYHGSTKVRSKGKMWRVKTPHCRALRKLNCLEDTIGDLKLPGKVSIELKPRDMDTWALVQSLAMNPRIRATVELQKPLSMLLAFLENRWQSENWKLREQINRIQTMSSEQESKRVLRVAPAAGVNITPISVNFSDIENSSNVSLLAHRNTHGISKESVESILQKFPSTKMQKPYVKRVRNETASLSSGSSVFNDSMLPSCVSVSCSSNDVAYDGEKNLDTLMASPPKSDPIVTTQDHVKEKKEEFIVRVKKGWTLANVESIKIGELYLICGSESKIQLEYWFEDCAETSNKNRLSQSLNKLISIAQYNSNTLKSCTCGFVNSKSHSLPRQTEIKTDADQMQRSPYSLVNSCKVMVHSPSLFRRPLQPKPLHSTSSFEAQVGKLQGMPRYCQRTGRPGNKHVGIVQKLLPLQPKTSLTIVQTSNFRPIIPAVKVEQTAHNVKSENDHLDQLGYVNDQTLSPPNKIWKSEPDQEDIPDDVSITSSTINRLIDNIPDLTSPSNFSGLLPNCSSSTSPSLITPSTSPSRLLKDDGNQWLNPEMDFSLSSFLGHLEKDESSNLTESDREKVISNDVEAQFQCLMSENSTDYTAKFADLAAKVAASNNNCQ
ncbi:protein cramped [Daktulosphaira vitifoliae]|uniref:protein cramped n=1 Tax=Daktulosphaira vitifoliae TaxID=58002 RepID=UPI0021AA1B50|nr:protein cramped [Daktulosphaira vitifoliae]XP_050544807.1 protein cramped [Daktulosphaira vitifoliae]XP_050544808.1 protein cramped [Daktulosphaira vitifoliae]XP_050544809.1 protein cramped [Daktulosphaira vitifoliae]